MKKPGPKKKELLERLRETLRMVNVGYPWYGVPKDIRDAIKYIKSH